jgi:NAD(P)-dependent dehydrogenase (short-subunit alcohol dehydrogenase family)
MSEPLLHHTSTIIYGAGGGIGSGVALEFARQGARLFLAGRTREPLERVADQAAALGAQADVAVVDALDEEAVERHADNVVAAAGGIDASINVISRGDVQGMPLTDMSAEDLMAPVITGLRANFLTARAAARRMARRGSGVILTVTSGSSHGAQPLMGGTGPADAAIESMLRYLAAETGPRGVRVLGLWTAGVPETFELEHDTNPARRAIGLSGEQIEAIIGPRTMLGRAPRLAQVAQSIAFLASDRAAGITATTLNVTCGLVPGP